MYGWRNDFGVGCLSGFVTQAYSKNRCFNKEKYNSKNLAVGVCASAESGEMHWNSPESGRIPCALVCSVTAALLSCPARSEDVLGGNTGCICLDVCAMKEESIGSRDCEERHLKNNISTRQRQHELTEGNLCSSNLVSFYKKDTFVVGVGKAVDAVFLGFSKAFDTFVLHSILLGKISSSGMSWFMVCWVKSRLDGRA